MPPAGHVRRRGEGGRLALYHGHRCPAAGRGEHEHTASLRAEVDVAVQARNTGGVEYGGSYDGWVAETRINPRREACTTMSRPPRASSFESGRIAATSIGAEKPLYLRGSSVLLVRKKIHMFSS